MEVAGAGPSNGARRPSLPLRMWGKLGNDPPLARLTGFSAAQAVTMAGGGRSAMFMVREMLALWVEHVRPLA